MIIVEKRSMEHSRVIQTRLVLPPDTNHLDTIFGGKILSYIDEVAALSAMKHAGGVVVTASIDSVSFLSSAKVGDALTMESFVTYTGTSSMEVYVKVTAHDIARDEEMLTTESFVTMVAVDDDGRPTPVSQVYPETEEEIKLHASAPARKKHRKARGHI